MTKTIVNKRLLLVTIAIPLVEYQPTTISSPPINNKQQTNNVNNKHTCSTVLRGFFTFFLDSLFSNEVLPAICTISQVYLEPHVRRGHQINKHLPFLTLNNNNNNDNNHDNQILPKFLKSPLK